MCGPASGPRQRFHLFLHRNLHVFLYPPLEETDMTLQGHQFRTLKDSGAGRGGKCSRATSIACLIQTFIRLVTKHLIVQFDFNLLFLFLPNSPGNEQITKGTAYKGKIMRARISLKRLAHIIMYTQVLDSALDWGLGDLAFVPNPSLLAKQPGMSLKFKDLALLTCQIELMISVYPTSLRLEPHDTKGCVLI